MSDKWWDMPDDELDDLFREASDKVEIPFDSSAFDKLRHKIDNQPEVVAPKSVKKRWLLPLALLLLVGVGMVYYFVNKKPEISTPNHTITSNSNNQSNKLSAESSEKNKVDNKNLSSATTDNKSIDVAKNIESSKNSKASNLKEGNDRNTLSPQTKVNNNGDLLAKNLAIKERFTTQNDKQQSLKIIENKNTEKIIPSSATESVKTVKEENASANSLINSPEFSSKSIESSFETEKVKSNFNNQWKVKNKKVSSHKNQFHRLTLSNKSENIGFETISIIPQKTEKEEIVNRTNFFGIDNLTSKKTKSLLTNLEVDLPPFVDSLPRPKSKPKMSRFGVRLALSPDINSIEKLQTSALSSSLGLLFEYGLSKKWILQTGLTYSNKKYGGEFDYYHSWADTWQKYHPSKPVEVDGGCKVIDIPLNLRFNAFQKPRQTWFVSAGISSYLMLNESYTYNYAWGTPKTVNWQDKTSYYWSTLNLSIGLEKQLTKHLTIQAEPYLKTPLVGVGRGSVNLYSSGILFSTKFNF
ncbi:outer membrane protein with beta-barrel domain [Arcicella aurantiaca]|uniref:Outer membrane protein with beta-barrel domain n=1 Tax=Arcicella aurantiaca TaxID=591202 RepID=A0A316EJG5_9BACT|nr:outer membrane beta-barrel protein [Arcicella aurantiaca]PWK28989.1 outer membrane protein with beta-barrel domain [Arcicella aurantiaca]